jgi:membrane-bound ClpP family serine protease
MYGVMIAIGLIFCFLTLFYCSKKKNIDGKFVDFVFYNGIASVDIGFGVAMLFLMAYIMKLVSKLQASGNIDIENAIGKVAQVYIPIAPSGSGFGKVTMTVQEKFCEFNAITTADYTLKTGLYVRIVAVDESGTLVVEPLGNSSRDAD